MKVTVTQCDFCKSDKNVFTLEGVLKINKEEINSCDICLKCLARQCGNFGVIDFSAPIPRDTGDPMIFKKSPTLPLTIFDPYDTSKPLIVS